MLSPPSGADHFDASPTANLGSATCENSGNFETSAKPTWPGPLTNMHVRTLRRYIEALGGELQVHAVFDDAIYEVHLG